MFLPLEDTDIGFVINMNSIKSESNVERILSGGLIVAALLTIPLVVAQERGQTGTLVTIFDWATWAMFALEYSVMLFLSSDRLVYVKGNKLSVAVVVLSFPALPAVFTLIRFLRIVRILVVSVRTIYALRVFFKNTTMEFVTALTFFLIVAGGGLFNIVEDMPGGFWGGVWWAIVTITTVGYGDISPQTTEGKLIGVTLMFAGVGLIATISASIASYFIGNQSNTDAELEKIGDRLSRIEELVRNLGGNSKRF